MSKNIRQRLINAIYGGRNKQNETLKKPNKIACCSIRKPDDYEYIAYEPVQRSSKKNSDDYVELRDCHSNYGSSTQIPFSFSADSGICDSECYDVNISSITTTNIKGKLESTAKSENYEYYYPSTISDLSSIPPQQLNLSNFHITSNFSTRSCSECDDLSSIVSYNSSSSDRKEIHYNQQLAQFINYRTTASNIKIYPDII
ncbi:unnamed protein product [Didymodactylos carnosus]|uniref:Uncharacterized protein n=1 Tax=Didymodactylos carnosus TaxID=1234261 RepID=A0A814ET22_9BILA|nr:unnamed protein product [Didymodactylos carnosus]CAF1076617.1 unnamed protein product [Didymodactylos carnosus]CAF3749252.1 unnamed protein product [Didymodactylos carnosus]CAF3840227.1 unnamed protein product [Didymodactylos carnosus]